MNPQPTTDTALPVPPPPLNSFPSRPSSTQTQRPVMTTRHTRDGTALHIGGQSLSTSLASSPVISEFANDFALPFQNSDTVMMYEPQQTPQVRGYQFIPYNHPQVQVQQPSPRPQSRQQAQPGPIPGFQPQHPHQYPLGWNQQQSHLDQPLQTPIEQRHFVHPPQTQLSQAQQVQAQQVQAQQAQLVSQLQSQLHFQQGQQLLSRSQTPVQPQPGRTKPKPDSTEHRSATPSNQTTHLHQQEQRTHAQAPQHQQSQRQNRQYPLNPDTPPNLPAPIAATEELPFIDNKGRVMVPFVEPVTGFVSYSTLDQYIQRGTHALAAEIKALQAESRRHGEQLTRKQIEIAQLVDSENTIRSQNAEGARLYNIALKKIHELETSVTAANAHFTRVVEDKSGGWKATAELEQKRAKLAENAATAASHQASAATSKLTLVTQLKSELETQKANLKLDVDRLTVELLLRKTQVKDSQKAHTVAVARAEQLEMENTLLRDEVNELKSAASHIIPSLVTPVVAIPDTTSLELQHSVIVNNFQLDIAALSSDLEVVRAELKQSQQDSRDLEVVRAELKQSQQDVQEARFPWLAMVDKEGNTGEGGQKAVDAVKARINSLEITITALEKEKAEIELERNQLVSEKERKRVKELAIESRRKTTRLEAQRLGKEDITECFPSPEPESSTTFPTDSLDTTDDRMEVEVEVKVTAGKNEECDCGREAVILEMSLKSEKVFEETLRLAKVTHAAAQIKLEDSPLKERSSRLRTVAVVSKYRDMVEGLVKDARVGMENRLG